jgi:hypothetical protein
MGYGKRVRKDKVRCSMFEVEEVDGNRLEAMGYGR